MCLACVRHGIFAQEEAGVHQQPLPRSLGVGEAVERRPACGRQLRLHPRCGQLRGIVAQGDLLRLAAVGTARASQRVVCGRGEGHHEDVAVFRSAARAAHVHLGEAVHLLGHRQPAAVGMHGAVGRRLRHAEGARRAYEHAPQTFAPDARVHVAGQRPAADALFFVNVGHHLGEQFRTVEVHQVGLPRDGFLVGRFFFALHGGHDADAVPAAEVAHFPGDASGRDFHVRRAAYAHPAPDALHVRGVDLHFHFRRQARELLQHRRVGEPEETLVAAEALGVDEGDERGHGRARLHVEEDAGAAPQRVEHFGHAGDAHAPEFRGKPRAGIEPVHVGRQHVGQEPPSVGRAVQRRVVQVVEHAVLARPDVHFNPVGAMFQGREGRRHGVFRCQMVGAAVHHHLYSSAKATFIAAGGGNERGG